MNNSKPRVSIGMPVFNGENFIAQALDSILAQTFSDFELIISDNGSTDRTGEICRAYAANDKRIRYYQNETNLGAAANYNRTFHLALGEYFKWAAHDDMCAPEFLERCIEILDRNPTVVVCYPGTILMNELGQVQGRYRDGLHLISPHPYQRFRQFFDTQGLCHAVFGLIRASVLKHTSLISNYAMSDRVLLGELALYGPLYELPEDLFYRRIHPKISTHANVTDTEIASWFDPKKAGKLLLPRWRRLFEYFKAVTYAPLNASERWQCYLQIGRFALFPARWAGIGEDLTKVTKPILRSSRIKGLLLTLLVIFVVLSLLRLAKGNGSRWK